VSGPKYICGQRSKMAFQGETSSCKIFCFLSTIWPLPSFSGWRFKYILTAANFLLRKNKYGCSLSYLYRKNDCV
jgi:hypothetical protein